MGKSFSDKISVTLYVEKEAFLGVKEFGEKAGQGISGIVDLYLQSMWATIKAVNLEKKKKLSRADFLRLCLKGFTVET